MPKDFLKNVLKNTMVNIFNVHHSLKNKIERILIVVSLVVAMFIYFKYRPNVVQMLIVSSNYFWLKAIGQEIGEGLPNNTGNKNPTQTTAETMVNEVPPDMEKKKKKLDNIYYLKDYIKKSPPKDMKLPLLLGIGEDGKPIYKSMDDIQSMFIQAIPKGGKSVALSAFLQYLFVKNPELYYIMVDFKDSELCFYENFNNTTYCTDEYQKLTGILKKLNDELDRRKNKIRKNYPHVFDYNDAKGKLEFPPILLVIDEISELKLYCKDKALLNKIENDILRLIRLGRAYGIYIWITTQRSDASQVDTRFKGLINFWLYGKMVDKTTKSVAGVGAGMNTATLKPGEFLMYNEETGEAIKVKVPFTHFYKAPDVYQWIQKYRDIEVMEMEKVTNNV